MILKDTQKLSQEDWKHIFTFIGKANVMIFSKPAFYEKFINNGIKYNYFSPELKEKINLFHEVNKDKTYKVICEQWSHTFANDFNLKDHFNVFLFLEGQQQQKNFFEFLEKKIGKKEAFYTINRFFLDDNNASHFSVLAKKWRELLEKYKFPINSEIVKRIVDDSISGTYFSYVSTLDKVLHFKMLVLGHHYNPNIRVLEDYICKHSTDALFEKKAFEYLVKKNIDISINSNTTTSIPFIKKEELNYIVKLEPEYLLKKYSLTRKNSETICRGFIGYIYKTMNKPSTNMSFTIELKCADIKDYENNKLIVEKNISNLEEIIDMIKEKKLTETGIAIFLDENIEKLLVKKSLESSLEQKFIQKKLKI